MTLRGINFGAVLNASGAQGFFGEGYPYHKAWRFARLTFDKVTFVAKTTTLNQRDGNMPMQPHSITPREFWPECIVVKPFKGVVLNAVGLSGPGLQWLLDRELWQRMTEPFFMSFMSVEKEAEIRLEETKWYVDKLKPRLRDFKAPVGQEINFSCPNVGLHPEELIGEVAQTLTIMSELGVPLVPKFNAMMPPEIARQIAEHPACDAICISNTIPWGQLPDRIDWKGLFGSEESPLKEFGNGGLSGKPLFPIVREWVIDARRAGLTKPINAGGGVLGPVQAESLLEAGADAIALGTIAMLRPWRMRRTIEAATSWHDWERE